MLDLFRRYQRFLYIVVTVVIVISFSFFGTYNSMSNSSFREQIAFKAVDGTSITRHELDEMAAFIGTDATDKVMFGGMWGPNFLNDGVIAKDFLETGLGVMLANAYPEDIRPDLQARLEKEKRFSLYTHPQAGFIGVESAWNHFAPTMTSYYHAMKSAQDPLTPEAIQARTALFLMEKQFSQGILHQVLRYQEKQNKWINPDPALDRTDLSLFGYHTLEDWFGPRYVRLVSEFIINSAKIAEQKGYQVTKADALASLIRNADLSFKQNASSPHIGVASSHEYLNEQLRRLGMDQNGAAAVWRQVMLFRLLFQDMGNSVFVDPYTFNKIDSYALESVSGEIYRLPKDLRLADFKSLQKFETYLDAVAKRSDADKTKLTTLPTEFLSVGQVIQKAPELVQKRYTLEISQITKKSLEGNVVVKDSWDWEVSEKGWAQLKKQFPELGTKPGTNREERFAALDSLDNKTRGRVDAFARAAIVDEHPEWLDKALADLQPVQVTLGLHENGKNPYFSGLKNGKALIQLLDTAPLVGQSNEIKPQNKEAADKLARYSADQAIYYNIKVVNRAPKSEILSFAEADQEGVLADLLDKNLEAAYPTIRETEPSLFQKSDGSWKSFADVKDLVAEKHFSKILEAIKASYAAGIAPESPPEKMIPDYAATLRLYSYVKDAKTKMQKDPAQINVLTRSPENKNETSGSFADQWKLEKAAYQTTRSGADIAVDHSHLFNIPQGAWTKVNTPANGDLNFIHIATKSSNLTEKAIAESVDHARTLLSDDAQQKLMQQVLKEIQQKGSISLDYLKKVNEIDEFTHEELQTF